MQNLNKTDRGKLLRIRWVLLGLLIGTALVGKHSNGWPILTWPMYSSKEWPYPGETTERVYLKVMLEDGSARRVDIGDLLPAGMYRSERAIFDAAFAEPPEPDARQLLVRTLRQHLPGEDLTAIELRRELWDVDPLARPPLDRANPREDLRIGRLELAEIDAMREGADAP